MHGNSLVCCQKRPEIQYAMTSFNTNFPQYQIDVNVARCKQSGVSVSSVLSVMQGYIGGYYASDFNRFRETVPNYGTSGTQLPWKP